MKDTYFHRKSTMNCKGKLISFNEPLVMSILNVTPDSFYDGGEYNSNDKVLTMAEQHLSEGADILDIGGYSSRPGAKEVSPEEELNRVIPAIEAIVNHFPDAIISIDTFRSDVAKQAILSGASIINDISAGELDSNMFKTVAELKVPYIMMHMKGTPDNMQNNPTYGDVTKEVIHYFSKKVNQLRVLGVNDIILDPGFGFGKTIEHNYELLSNLKQLNVFGLPVLAGISRKSMLYKPLGITPKEALNATTTANTIALNNGASLLRVHDTKEAKECIKICQYLT